MVDHRLGIEFAASIAPSVRRRIDYAFRLFCAVWGYRPGDASSDVRLCYGTAPRRPTDVPLTAAYRPLDARRASEGGGRFPQLHGSAAGTDWLGEIFEWVSGDHERSVTQTDGEGRVPFEKTLHGELGLDPAVPYAAVAMHELNREIRAVAGSGWPEAPASPWSTGPRVAIAATHDVDFLPLSSALVARRWIKNVLIAAGLHRDPRLAAAILRRGLLGARWGGSALDGIDACRKREIELGIESSWYFIPRKDHGRDAPYEIADPKVVEIVRRLSASGAEIGVHGSYTSLTEPGRLAEEYRRMAELGFASVGGRQHWLRYRGPELFDAIARAGAWYDSTVGYSVPGFRGGACFPYPPYDFASESAYPFLEIPLILMDVTLYRTDRDEEGRLRRCRAVMDATRRWGWGGVGILWHDTVYGGAQLPEDIGEAYWKIRVEDERWISARRVAEETWGRYAMSGLLPDGPPRQ